MLKMIKNSESLIASLITVAKESVMADAVNELISVVDHTVLLNAFNAYDALATRMCMDDTLGFLYDYFHLSKYVSNHGKWVREHEKTGKGKYVPRIVLSPYRIVDVGCASGIQQAFFPNYLGIDYQTDNLPRLHDGASFMKGKFSNLIESGELVIDRERDFGIANMSLLYGGHDEELFKKVFKRCVII
jgi:hypothetical protein